MGVLVTLKRFARQNNGRTFTHELSSECFTFSQEGQFQVIVAEAAFKFQLIQLTPSLRKFACDSYLTNCSV